MVLSRSGGAGRHAIRVHTACIGTRAARSAAARLTKTTMSITLTPKTSVGGAAELFRVPRAAQKKIPSYAPFITGCLGRKSATGDGGQSAPNIVLPTG